MSTNLIFFILKFKNCEYYQDWQHNTQKYFSFVFIQGSKFIYILINYLPIHSFLLILQYSFITYATQVQRRSKVHKGVRN